MVADLQYVAPDFYMVIHQLVENLDLLMLNLFCIKITGCLSVCCLFFYIGLVSCTVCSVSVLHCSISSSFKHEVCIIVD